MKLLSLSVKPPPPPPLNWDAFLMVHLFPNIEFVSEAFPFWWYTPSCLLVQGCTCTGSEHIAHIAHWAAAAGSNQIGGQGQGEEHGSGPGPRSQPHSNPTHGGRRCNIRLSRALWRDFDGSQPCIGQTIQLIGNKSSFRSLNLILIQPAVLSNNPTFSAPLPTLIWAVRPPPREFFTGRSNRCWSAWSSEGSSGARENLSEKECSQCCC